MALMLRVFAFAALALSLAEPARAMQSAYVDPELAPGQIIISQSQRRLYFTLGDGRAIVYPVAVAKHGKEWFGRARVDGKYVEPAWSPPVSVKRDHPELPDVVAGGSPHNPMGARALTLDRDEIAIHGTTKAMRASVGGFASYGCIRMYNEDVIDLFSRVAVGAPVTMTR